MQTTLLLTSSIPIHGFDDEQAFTFFYHADNLVVGNTTLGPATIPLPQDRLDKIARTGNPQIKTLSLTLKEVCPVWGPSASGNIAPKSDFDASFHQLVQLAGALQVHILFDYSRLHQDHHTRFGRLFSHAEVLTGVPIERNFAKLHQRVEWSVLNTVEAGAAEAPPSYSDVSNKRSRQPASSTSFDPPSSKRALLSPPYIDPPSPTETGTTASTPSRKPQTSPPAYAPASEDATRNALATILPVLQSILPDLIRPLLTVPPLSSSLPSTTTDAKILSPLSTLLDARVTALIEAQQPKLYDGMLDYAQEISNTAGVELQETLEDHRLDIGIAREDGIAELNTVIDDKLQDFKARTEEIVEELGEHAEKVYTETREKLDDLVERQMASLRRNWEELERERSEFKAEKERTLGQKSSRDQSRRAMSSPL